MGETKPRVPKQGTAGPATLKQPVPGGKNTKNEPMHRPADFQDPHHQQGTAGRTSWPKSLPK